MSNHAGSNLRLFLVVACILVVLLILYLNIENIIREQEEGIATYSTGTDDQSRIIRNELEQYLYANKIQQRGIIPDFPFGKVIFRSANIV